ncbi:MAG: hypothetical protein WC378_14900 [Opitutaceae bacterium]|jgi:predicted Zn-dependent protease
MHDGIPALKRREYALGYLSLGMTDEALAEIALLSAEDRDAAETMAILIDIHMARDDWVRTVDMAREYAARRPKEEKGWISWAYALREMDKVKEAREVLLRAEPFHGRTCGLLQYNLACYFFLLGEKTEARRRLKAAIMIDPSLAADAIRDPDLKGIAAE